jgi:hypothetical protein
VVFGRSRLGGLGSSSKVDREGLQLHREHKGFGSIPGLEGNIDYPVPMVRALGAERYSQRNTDCRSYLHTIEVLEICVS